MGVTARGITAAGRTMAMTAIVDGAELLSTFIVVLLSLGYTRTAPSHITVKLLSPHSFPCAGGSRTRTTALPHVLRCSRSSRPLASVSRVYSPLNRIGLSFPEARSASNSCHTSAKRFGLFAE